ncbi:hypothetical protein A5645_03810 [Mycobacterium asiaticum]|uniref:PPE family protein n=1 Tax=Mycobacterium asiaticum TaxID=1790 RepID=UPI0007EFFC49|nr:PPE family protein [Mycobacterium asiaticum]OBK98197.1 hypothetical protein A5645_03810 [Mycobacterium asiaticum]
MDFGALPPEINSARMYSGPGAASMLAAAAAWEATAENLYAAAASCNDTLSALTDQAWRSDATQAMTAAAGTYLAWMTKTAARAQHSAAQLRMAAMVFETARSATVPPPVVAANRALLMLLTATNVLGVNTLAIAAAEADYGEMWAQDAAAMYGYASGSAAASTLTAFVAPNEVADAAGLAELSAVIWTVPQTLQQLAQPLQSGTSTFSSSVSAMSSLSSVAKTLGSSTAALSSEVSGLAGAAGTVPLPAGLIAGWAPSGVSAQLGRAAHLGPLSVPQSWTSVPATHRPVELADAVAAATPDDRANALGGLPFAGMAPRAENTSSGTAPRAGTRLTVMPRPEFIG